ncbi:MurR/RpiR family transcriptional regulator [Georhizobium profundi]|uniref:MurR/RpiR family transcriptional regulator n=1 Tax=Georhizobium profundi TaxID=2341112 RepID=A0A3S9AZP8_9HYPH|nr:MurR/RpiR family transcriptional regulator [Georhizobium profundi]AZN70167.1 MurR/RpiR family transcriptional regulator [Georhizobium profundi]
MAVSIPATVETTVHATMDALTSAEKRAARTLLANYPTIGLAPVAEFGTAAGASAATVLRFISRLGFRSYPDFQRALRTELDERTKSPLQRSFEVPRQESERFLDRFFEQTAEIMRATAERIPASEFEAASRKLADSRNACHLAGGRFTDALAMYMEAHLRRARPGVRRLDGRIANRADQLLDIKAGDVVVLFDMRRYDDDLLETARQLKAARAFTILMTDEWISPISRFSKIVLPCRVSIDRIWDANTAMFALVEALIARTTELSWKTAESRIRVGD